MARRRHRHEALLQSITPRNDNNLTKLNGSSLLNEIHLWTHHMKQARKLRLVSCTKKECRTNGHSFRPSISSAVACAASSPIGFLSSFEDTCWIANSQINILIGDVVILWAISIANNANNGRDWNEDKSDTFVHSFSAHVIALFHCRMLISFFGRPFYTVFGHKCHSPSQFIVVKPP